MSNFDGNLRYAFEVWANNAKLAFTHFSSFSYALRCWPGDHRQVAKQLNDSWGGFPGDWPEAVSDLTTAVRKTPPKPQKLCEAFVDRVVSLCNFLEQIERSQRSKSALPYMILSHGPTELPCPNHKQNTVGRVDNPYWRAAGIRERYGCRCSVRAIPRSEFNRLKQGSEELHRLPPPLPRN